tara:strand:- start:1325 stop:2239 length:915 start_codon:yes stop_codon:yes gene_type:complete
MTEKTDWVSCYVFHNISFEKVLTELIKPLIEKLNKDQFIKQYFFIRYWENGPHIRLRLLLIDNKFKNKIEKLIKFVIKRYFNLPENEAKYSIKFNDYIQEIERFGGNTAITIAENHFQDSSNIVLNRIDNNYLEWDYSMAIVNAIQMHLIFAKQIINTRNEAELFFDFLYKNWIQHSVKLNKKNKITANELIKVNQFFKSSYEKQKKNINFITKKVWFDEQLEEVQLKDWSLYCKKLSRQIKESNKIILPKWIILEADSKLSKEKQTLWIIYDSYIHMTNNRLGIHLRDEAFIAYMILRGLKKL